MAQPDVPASEPSPPLQQPSTPSSASGFLRKLFGRQNGSSQPSSPTEPTLDSKRASDPVDLDKAGLIRRMSRKVVPGLPRAQTFKRQQSERRNNLAPVDPTPDERRALSVDRRSHGPRASSTSQAPHNPRTSAPGFLGCLPDDVGPPLLSSSVKQLEEESLESKLDRMVAGNDDTPSLANECPMLDTVSITDAQSMTTSQYDAMIHDELERIWILNLSMHFRDRSKREKFFVTYREQEHVWRRVTVSLDYRDAPVNSLEMDLSHMHYQRDKSAKIYEAIRESLPEIQFYDTVTNLKLQTTDGRLHVHVVEDGNEIVNFPTVSQIKHLGCKRIKEQDIIFDSHMSGFVYKVNVHGQTLIKKEIPSPDTIDEFLYEVNALSRLRFSRNVIQFYGVVVDENDEHVKGLLIDYAAEGALIDIIFEKCKEGRRDIARATKEKWAWQIVQGLSDIHECGFVQGDFTLSNIVIDDHGDAKIIDINRRGCPVGWEPPEATALLESNNRMSMYIGVKSDLYQLGMVLWALAMQEDEPETQGRPLVLGPEINVPDWYREMAEICLSDDPRLRLQTSSLLQMFAPGSRRMDAHIESLPPQPIDNKYVLQNYLADGYAGDEPIIRTVEPSSDWSCVSRPYTDASPSGYDFYHHSRGRSPPSPLPSNYDKCDSSRGLYDVAAWAANRHIPSSYSDVDVDDVTLDDTPTMGSNALTGGPKLALTPEASMRERVEEPSDEKEVKFAKEVENIDPLSPVTDSIETPKPGLPADNQLLPTPNPPPKITLNSEKTSPISRTDSPGPNVTVQKRREASRTGDLSIPARVSECGSTTMTPNSTDKNIGLNGIGEQVKRRLATQDENIALGKWALNNETRIGREQETIATQLKGTTAPQKHHDPPEVSSKPELPSVVTSMKSPERPTTTAEVESDTVNRKKEPERMGTATPLERSVDKSNEHQNTLVGIGAAHLTNSDTSNKIKSTIHEDLKMVEQGPSPTTTAKAKK